MFLLVSLQGGPLPVINAVTTPISRVITPVTHLFSAIYRGPITSFITIGSGPAHISMYSMVYLPTFTITINHSCRYTYTSRMDGMD